MTPITRQIADLSRICLLRAHRQLRSDTPRAPLPRGGPSFFRELLAAMVSQLPPEHTRQIPLDDARQVRIEATREALDDPSVQFLVSPVLTDGAFEAVPHILRRSGDGFHGMVLRASPNRKKAMSSARRRLAWWRAVMERQGLALGSAELVFLKGGRLRRPGDSHADFIQHRDLGLPDPTELAPLERLLDDAEPSASTGPQCYVQGDCPFLHRCHEPIWRSGLPRLNTVTVEQQQNWSRQGWHTPAEIIRHDGRRLSAAAVQQLESLQGGDTWAHPSLGASLLPLRRGFWTLDFELLSSAFPPLVDTAPFEQLPVQWSAHQVLDGRVAHRDWFFEGHGHPAEACAESLVKVLGNDPLPIVVYSNHEGRILRNLATQVPHHAEALMSLRHRILDLQAVIASSVQHPAIGRSRSLKVVYPALVPGRDWSDLRVRNGAQAHTMLHHWFSSTGERADDDRTALLAYCARDTMALVELVDALQTLAAR